MALIENSVTITGNITRDPEMTVMPTGNPVTNFGLAYNARKQNRETKEWEDDVSFFDVACFGDLAVNVAGSLAKGTRVTVLGRLKQQNWVDKGSGEKRSRVNIIADDVAASARWAAITVTKIAKDSAAGGGANRAPAYEEEPF